MQQEPAAESSSLEVQVERFPIISPRLRLQPELDQPADGLCECHLVILSPFFDGLPLAFIPARDFGAALQAVSHLVSDLSVALSLRHLMTPASLVAGSVRRLSLRDPRSACSRQ